MPVPCPKCTRPVADGKPMCMYCGAVVVKMEPCHRAMRAAPALAAGLRSLELLEAGVRKRRWPEQEGDAAATELLRQSVEHQRRHDLDAAMPLVLTVLAQFPGDPAAWITFGSIFLAVGDAATALRCAELALAIAPQRRELQEFSASRRGRAAAQVGRVITAARGARRDSHRPNS